MTDQKIIDYDPCISNGLQVRIDLAQYYDSLDDKEKKYQLWKHELEEIFESLGLSCYIYGDIFVRNELDEYLGIGCNLRDVYFNSDKFII